MCRCQRACYARPPIGIHECAFDLVRDNLISLKYDGTVGLSCDDTKLMAAFRPYYDQERDAHFILGNTGEPYRLIDPDIFQEVLDSGTLEKATKVRRSSPVSQWLSHISLFSFVYGVCKYLSPKFQPWLLRRWELLMT